MRSGIGDFFGDRFESTPKDKLRTIADYLPLFADKPLEFEPGASEKYSNGGYVVLGAIIEKVTGMSYFDYVRENIFKPLGMTSTDSYGNNEHPANSANGYTKHSSEWVDNTDSRPWRGSSAGGGYSNVPDLVKFATALRDHKIVNIGDQGSPMADVHMMANGGAPGINAAVGVDETTGDIVIVLANYDPPAASGLASQITGWLRNIK
jgi:D-alanyl-D-alanine carboxypeptidase